MSEDQNTGQDTKNDVEMVAGCVNGIPVIKMPKDLAELLGFKIEKRTMNE